MIVTKEIYKRFFFRFLKERGIFNDFAHALSNQYNYYLENVPTDNINSYNLWSNPDAFVDYIIENRNLSLFVCPFNGMSVGFFKRQDVVKNWNVIAYQFREQFKKIIYYDE